MSAALSQLPVAAQEGAGLPRVDTAALDVSSPDLAPAASAAGAVFSGRKCRGPSWAADEDDMLRWLCSHNTKWARIAVVLGYSEKACQARARRIGAKLGVSTAATMPPPPKPRPAVTEQSRDAAEHYRSRLSRTATTQRNCLRCQKEFLSWGAGNRMCSYCRLYAE